MSKCVTFVSTGFDVWSMRDATVSITNASARTTTVERQGLVGRRRLRTLPVVTSHRRSCSAGLKMNGKRGCEIAVWGKAVTER